MSTDRYNPAIESDDLSDVLFTLWDGRRKVGEVADRTGTAVSTASTKLQALRRDGLATKDKWYYELDKDEIYTRFTSYLLDELERSHDPYQNRLVDAIADDLLWHDEIREHLMQYLKYELKYEEASLQELFQKYRDEEIIRMHLIYQLSNTPLEVIPDEKREFWDYLTVLQGWLNRGVWTETQHAVSLQSQVFPGEEEKMASMDDEWRHLADRAQDILEERLDDEVIREAQDALLEDADEVHRVMLEILVDADGGMPLEELRETYLEERDISGPDREGVVGVKHRFRGVRASLEEAGIITVDDGTVRLAIDAVRVEEFV